MNKQTDTTERITFPYYVAGGHEFNELNRVVVLDIFMLSIQMCFVRIVVL